VILFSGFVFCWLSGADIIYALMDVDNDRQNNIHSLPAWMGADRRLRVAAGVHLMAWGILVAVVQTVGGGPAWPGCFWPRRPFFCADVRPCYSGTPTVFPYLHHCRYRRCIGPHGLIAEESKKWVKMVNTGTPHLILGITGATGIHASRLLVEKSRWPVDLVASRWGREVAGIECGGIEAIEAKAARVFAPEDLVAPLSSGSVPAVGMVVLPCSAHTLAQIAAGLGDSLITRAAHCQLKERRPLILCLREAP
jgi:hypothetical protein